MSIGAPIHSGLSGRRYDGARGIHGRVPVSGSTRLIIATDGSWKDWISGSGYVTHNGYWELSGRILKGPRQLNPIHNHGTGALAAELRAVGMALERFPGRAARILVDSQAALGFLWSWQAGDIDRMPTGYSLRPRINGDSRPALVRFAELIAGRTDLRFVHVRGHDGHAMNEVADSLAKIGRTALANRRRELEVAERATALVAAFMQVIRGGEAA
ncbi:ribonuclease H-like protein [Nocardia nova SH22a]|uniref:Ribonuclease H-like protein n=1 Tax=Nocardia nova SH22a TaxID=1415166 RepID=W5TP91_9NOCA|nr:RNase H family protein [Nocardia nova]AHH20768.1 ribonuclease H-like protein [Nocardia nova SH22a]